MGTLVILVVAVALPTLVGCAAITLVRVARAVGARRHAGTTTARPIEQVAADLRRLRAELESAENRPRTTAKGTRVRALRQAYADTLATACAQLGVMAPAVLRSGRASRTEVYRIEAALRERGLDVRTASGVR